MENLNYKKLQPLSANNPENKTKLAKDNETCIKQIEVYLNNFREYLLSQNIYDTASLLIAEQDWLKRKERIPLYNNIVGRLLKVDFGKTYLSENGLIHFALCIAENNNKFLVIPCTTSTDEIKIAYHPEFRNTGEKRLYLLKKSDGNTKDCALYMNDAKYISSGRIIQILNNISKNAYNNIINLFCEISLPDIYEKFTNEKLSLESKVELLKEIITNKKD